MEIQLEADAGQAYPVVPADPDAFQSGLRRRSRPTAKSANSIDDSHISKYVGPQRNNEYGALCRGPPYSNRSYSWISEVHGRAPGALAP